MGDYAIPWGAGEVQHRETVDQAVVGYFLFEGENVVVAFQVGFVVLVVSVLMMLRGR